MGDTLVEAVEYEMHVREQERTYGPSCDPSRPLVGAHCSTQPMRCVRDIAVPKSRIPPTL